MVAHGGRAVRGRARRYVEAAATLVIGVPVAAAAGAAIGLGVGVVLAVMIADEARYGFRDQQVRGSGD